MRWAAEKSGRTTRSLSVQRERSKGSDRMRAACGCFFIVTFVWTRPSRKKGLDDEEMEEEEEEVEVDWGRDNFCFFCFGGLPLPAEDEVAAADDEAAAGAVGGKAYPDNEGMSTSINSCGGTELPDISARCKPWHWRGSGAGGEEGQVRGLRSQLSAFIIIDLVQKDVNGGKDFFGNL